MLPLVRYPHRSARPLPQKSPPFGGAWDWNQAGGSACGERRGPSVHVVLAAVGELPGLATGLGLVVVGVHVGHSAVGLGHQELGVIETLVLEHLGSDQIEHVHRGLHSARVPVA